MAATNYSERATVLRSTILVKQSSSPWLLFVPLKTAEHTHTREPGIAIETETANNGNGVSRSNLYESNLLDENHSSGPSSP